MPYCEAAVLEGVRMFMGHTFGIPHRALRDTKFRGYDIPKVSSITIATKNCSIPFNLKTRFNKIRIEFIKAKN